MDGFYMECLDDWSEFNTHLMQRSSGEAFELRRCGDRCADDGDTEVAHMDWHNYDPAPTSQLVRQPEARCMRCMLQ
jgi:hypothetical protein